MITGGLITPFDPQAVRRAAPPPCCSSAPSASVPLTLIGLIDSFWVVVVLIVLWGLADAAADPSGGRT